MIKLEDMRKSKVKKIILLNLSIILNILLRVSRFDPQYSYQLYYHKIRCVSRPSFKNIHVKVGQELNRVSALK